MTDAFSQPSSNYINGSFETIAGDGLVSTNPADPEAVVWSGTPTVDHVDPAVAAARAALPGWSATPIDERIAVLRAWAETTRKHVERIAGVITDEMGKTLAESRFEANALGSKVEITLGSESMGRVAEYEVPINDSRVGRCRFKPHGVLAVIGPFNFPAHLPNGHFVPALLMGDTVVVKPSDKTPAVGQLLAELMHEAGVPKGVFNVIQGEADVASALVSHDDIDGVLFTGSWPVGRRIMEANLDRPGRMLALEMGGNNPAVILPDAHFRQAAIECARAAFATTGQRCTCTRRIIVHREVADRFIAALAQMASTLIIGPGRSENPVFMGPLATEAGLTQVLDAQAALVAAGGRVVVESTAMDRPGAFITPGVIEVDGFSPDRDEEIFGPIAQVTVVDDLDAAIEQANATRFGLAASIFTQDETAFETFFHAVNAGCINWNTGTAGASSKLPFGGLGISGNHRPAAAFAAEYCAYPVANMVESGEDAAVPAGMTWDDDWAGDDA